jgi:hypothetical protein
LPQATQAGLIRFSARIDYSFEIIHNKTPPLKDKKVAVFSVCGGFYGSFMHGFVKSSIKSKGAEVQGLYVVKSGGKTDAEIEEQVAAHLKAVLSAE